MVNVGEGVGGPMPLAVPMGNVDPIVSYDANGMACRLVEYQRVTGGLLEVVEVQHLGFSDGIQYMVCRYPFGQPNSERRTEVPMTRKELEVFELVAWPGVRPPLMKSEILGKPRGEVSPYLAGLEVYVLEEELDL